MRASTPISPITIKGRLVFISTKRYRLTRKRMERGSGATWTGSPKGVFAGRKHHKPRQGVVANTFAVIRSGAVGFIDWLDTACFELRARQRRRARPGCWLRPWCVEPEHAVEVDRRAAVKGTSGNMHRVDARHRRRGVKGEVNCHVSVC